MTSSARVPAARIDPVADGVTDGSTGAGASAARDRILDAGAALVAGAAAADLLPGVRAVCRQARLSTGSFYHCFTDVTAFHVALVERLVDHPGAAARVERGCADAERIAREGANPADVVAEVAANGGAGLDLILASLRDATRARQLLTTLADRDDQVAGAIRAAYAESIERTSRRQRDALAQCLDTIGCSIRPPFTIESVVDLLSAVSDGLVMRAHLQPGFDAATLLEDTVRLVFVALLCDDGDPLDLDEILAVVVQAEGRCRGVA